MRLLRSLLALGLALTTKPHSSVLALSGTSFRFKLNQLYELSVGLENLRGTPAAFGDFNNNQQTDLFVISPDQKQVQLWLWNASEKQFQHLTSADISVDFALANVVVGDFDMDGNLDVLVQGAESGGKVAMQVFRGDGVQGFAGPLDLPLAANALPFAFDYRGEGRTDLLGVSWDQKDSQSGTSVWAHTSASATTANSTDLWQLENFESSDNTTAMCRPASPHSSAFVDLNGDCLADLFVVCDGNEEYQIWTNSDSGFVFAQSGKLPSNAGPVSFADMNSDGSIDMVIPIVGATQIYIVYNEQLPLCVGAAKKGGGEDVSCRKFKKICEASDFGFSLKDAQIVDIGAIWSGETLLVAIDSFSVPPPVRLADLNLDGYPDMAFITKKDKTTHVRMLKSESCSGCTAGSSNLLGRRSYAAVTDGVDVLNTLGRPQDMAFFDIDGTGTADLLVHYLDSKNNRRVAAIYNNFFTDAFFIKARACPSAGKLRSYAGLVPGASFKYLLMSDSGQKHVAQAVQAPQSAYRALFTPYTIIGIGRTNNYIEDFSVGSTSQRGSRVRSFEGLIPNSKVVVFPVNTTDDWRLELYMNRSESTPYILATLLSAMAVLAITVVALGALERKADNRDKQRTLHSINFDAL
ncbi:hypothetical protein GGI15_001724 [Coemansia interrupta]|uniref:T-cell immunomodulatory protein TIP C2 domain-containing protein n=1 Tax=Coemansia interrupta TaxID=1126814 RepID=A0A9W8HIY7_9FUNG|nr:hypothetical protein GGI15_001724 [Coemansia interrupta]